MPERDGYIPGVPCWIDTSQPDPEAAVDFYSGLFGWEFEDVMPPGSPGKYFIAPHPRRRRRRGRVDPRGRAADGDVEHLHLGRQRRRDRGEGRATPAAASLMEPFDVMDAGRMAVFADPEGAAFCVWQAKEHKGAQVVNEHGSLNFNGLNTRDAGRREVVLRLGVRLGDARRSAAAPRCGRCPATATTSSSDNPGLRKQMAEMGAPDGLRGRRREHQPDPGRPARHARRTGA